MPARILQHIVQLTRLPGLAPLVLWPLDMDALHARLLTACWLLWRVHATGTMCSMQYAAYAEI